MHYLVRSPAAAIYFRLIIIALLVSIPFGRLADRQGRKPVFMLSLTGNAIALTWVLIVCKWEINYSLANFHGSLPIGASPKIMSLKWIWLCALFSCIGGGSSTADSMLMAIAADSCESKHRLVISL
jgi:MFS family permease